jgi:hypothetical protein
VLSPTVAAMIAIGLLRFIGLSNAALWFGTIAFQLFVSSPAMGSAEMQQLLGPKNFPFFSAAISHVISARCYTLFLVCSVIALLHLGADWLYSGKHPKRASLVLVFALFLCGELQSRVLQPKLQALLLEQHRPGVRTGEPARNSLPAGVWPALSTAVNLLLLGGLCRYLWQMAHPPEETHFVGAGSFSDKFRS